MSAVLSNVSNALAATVEQASPVVVKVDGRSRLPASGVVWNADGVIVTTNHGLEQDTDINVGLPDGGVVPAVLAGRDPGTDLAVLRVAAGGLTPPTWGQPEEIKVGHLVLALGRPGSSIQSTLGIVSVLGQGWRTPTGGTLDYYLRTDLTMYPGFSGGPLVDAAGRVLGVNTSAFLRGAALTITTPTLRKVVEMLLTHGKVQRGYLGVGAQPTRLPETLVAKLGQETGLLLTSVEPEGPAAAGGLFLGDTLVSLAKQPVGHLDDLLALLTGDRVGTALPARILRGGQLQELSVTIGLHP